MMDFTSHKLNCAYTTPKNTFADTTFTYTQIIFTTNTNSYLLLSKGRNNRSFSIFPPLVFLWNGNIPVVHCSIPCC